MRVRIFPIRKTTAIHLMFESEVFINRRKQLIRSMSGGIVLLSGNSDSPMNYADNIYPFRQDSTFLYYTGISRPDLFLIIDIDNHQTTLIGSELTIDDIIWSGSQPDLVELGEICGADHVMDSSNLSSVLAKALSLKRPLHYLTPYRAKTIKRLERLIGLDAMSDGGSVELASAVIDQRSVKEPREVKEIETALGITQKMYLAAMRSAESGKYERELAGLVEGIAISGGGRLAYPCILTKHGQVLHNHQYHRRLEHGDLVVQDSGAATILGYASDITRTYPVSGSFSSRQAEVYLAVLQSLMGAVSSIRPGLPFRESHLIAARILTDHLQQIGLMRGDLDESVAIGSHALFFPHGLGHMMGLDVHDMENLGEDLVGYNDHIQRSSQFGLRSLRFGRSPSAGYVLTVEPGCYFISPLIDKWKKEKRHINFINYDRLSAWENFGGIRIEENILVTTDGCRVLGPPIPKDIQDVEDACRG